MPVIDIAGCEPLRIEQISAPGILLPITEDDEACLCLSDGGEITAMFLTGEWAYYSDKVSALSERRGFFIPDVSIKVDLDSMMGDGGSGSVGRVIRSPGVYGIRTHRQPASGGAFTQTVLVPIDGVAPQAAPNSVRVAFTKWQVGKQVGNDWLRLWDVNLADA